MQTTDILNDIINEFEVKKFENFFRSKNDNYDPSDDDISDFIKDKYIEKFSSIQKIGHMQCDGIHELIVVAARVTTSLTERSGKKAQYTLGKTILRTYNRYIGGFFIFYDDLGNFRFSFIYSLPQPGGRQVWSNFRRYTYYVSKEQTNRTFLRQVGGVDFSTFNNIKEAFSVEPVTKQFYKEVQNWYYWALKEAKFPNDLITNDNPKNATNIIRLITRLTFIWFLKQKQLIPSTLFDPNEIKNIVKDFGKDTNYYNAILQNLFFATLNTPIEYRGWAEDKGYPANKENFGLKNKYRYEEKFLISKEEALKVFQDIPFLNGGLFDCLDKDKYYVDGFSRNRNKQAKLPDKLFFQSHESELDLLEFGLSQREKVRGLIDIFNDYSWTTDESSPIDEEVALDPELLGKIFENLLATYNPETHETARKSTGSYYTPREIVNYMVEESLFEYFKSKLTNFDQQKLREILSYNDNENMDLTDEEITQIITTIDNLKIFDPACGSGAFPMGILHKLVHILQKIDLDNKYWRELQYNKAVEEVERTFKEENNKDKREEYLKEINNIFDEKINYPDYARKLYLIENCIYGADIQNIAIQISKLRFFISLIIDQKVDKTKENFGIRPLPNLETKFVCANTLIGLDIPDINLFSSMDKIKNLEDELKKIRHKYFTAKNREQKQYLQEQDKKIRNQITELLEEIIINKKNEKIEEIKNKIKEQKEILSKLENNPEEKQIMETNNIFGEKEETIIDNKQEKLDKQRKKIQSLNKDLNQLLSIKDKNLKQKAKKIASFDVFDQNGSADWFDPEWMFGVKKEIIEERKECKAFNITWVTHNSRRRETDMPSKTQGEEPVILDYEDRQAVAQILAERIKEKKYRVLAMNVLEDHVHILLVAEQNEVPKIVQDLKGYSSYAYHLSKATHGATDVVHHAVPPATHGYATHGLTRGLPEDARGLREHAYGLPEHAEQPEPEDTGHTEYTNNTVRPSAAQGAHCSIPATPIYADGTKQKLWAKSYSDTYIQDEVHLKNAIEYIKNNHNKHNILPIDFTRFNDAFTTLEKAFQPVIKETGFDIVIGNPPYLRQEKIDNKDVIIESISKSFTKNAQTLIKINKRSDLYVYFYYKGLSLLKTSGIFCYISSNSWLDVGFGAELQEFLLRYQKPLMIVDNLAERSFEADINTVIVFIEKPQTISWEDKIKFVVFKKPFGEIIKPEILSQIHNVKEKTMNETFRLIPKTRKELWLEGIETEEDQINENRLWNYPYIGNKWGGKYLRAPEIFFKILENPNIRKLYEVANIKSGIITGNNKEYYTRIINPTPNGFEPCWKSPKEIKKIKVEVKDVLSMIKNINIPFKIKKAKLLWPDLRNDIHVVHKNEDYLAFEHNFYGIDAITEENNDKLCLILNSTFSFLIFEILTRTGLGGGAGRLVKLDIKNFPILNPDCFSLKNINNLNSFINREICSVFEELGFQKCNQKNCKHPEHPYEYVKPEEVSFDKIMPDRRELDKIVFEALGLTEDEQLEVYRAVLELVKNRLLKAKSK